MAPLTTSINTILEIASNTLKQEKKKDIHIGWGEVKLPLFIDSMIFYVENQMEST